MRAGDRVRTPDGLGTVTSILTDEVWTFRQPTRTVYAIVQLDDDTYRAMYPPSDLEEITMETTTTETVETVETTTTPEPEPTPTDPEPEGDDDTTDDDDPAE